MEKAKEFNRNSSSTFTRKRTTIAMQIGARTRFALAPAQQITCECIHAISDRSYFDVVFFFLEVTAGYRINYCLIYVWSNGLDFALCRKKKLRLTDADLCGAHYFEISLTSELDFN